MKCIFEGCELPADEETCICREHSPRRPGLLKLALRAISDLLAEIFR